MKLIFIFTFICLGSSCLYSQQSNQCVKIDFEKIYDLELYEGLPIYDQFFEEYGVIFELDNGEKPLLAEVGGFQAFAFGSAYGNDTPAPGQNVGRFFITDDGLLSGLNAHSLIVKFTNPVDSVSAEVLDIDFDEIFTVTARDEDGNTLLTKTIKAGDPGTGDGKATLFGFNMDGCIGSIYSLKFEGKRQAQGAFGFAMDNFSFCFTGIDIENVLDYNLVGPTCADTLGRIEFINNGDFDLLYSLDNVTFFEFDEIQNLASGAYEFFVKSLDGCEAIINLTIPELKYPFAENILTSNTQCGLENGRIEIIGSETNLLYSLNGLDFIDRNSFEQLPHGVYNIVIKNSIFCTDTLFITIDPSDSIVIHPISTFKDLCQKGVGSISFEESPSSNYQYYVNDILVANYLMDNLNEGIYKIKIMDNFGCSADTLVEILSTPKIILNNLITRPAECNEDNGEISFSISADESNFIVLLNGMEIISNNIYDLSAGIYNLEIIDEYDCKVQNVVRVDKGKCPVFVPNIIYGNSNGLNNLFWLKTADNYELGIKKYRIYDRWGNLVFDAGAFNIHNHDYWWNGYFKGIKAESGVYTYLIEVRHPNGDEEFLAGDVTLIW